MEGDQIIDSGSDAVFIWARGCVGEVACARTGTEGASPDLVKDPREVGHSLSGSRQCPHHEAMPKTARREAGRRGE